MKPVMDFNNGIQNNTLNQQPIAKSSAPAFTLGGRFKFYKSK